MVNIQLNNAKPVTLTDAAAKHIQQKLIQDSNTIGFRLGVKNAGCNSKKYITELVTTKKTDDIEYDDHGVKIFISKPDLLYIAGTTVDLVQQGINKVLKFNNPNVDSECGCGESFDIKK